ncbi:MAG: DUF5615 family PIN-like protein [Candidatus Woesearchaeota archaeon]
MRFLADENIAVSVVKALRHKGYDVLDLKEEKKHGITDTEVLELAKEQKRVILTHDKDFVELLKQKNALHYGLLVLRYRKQDPLQESERIIALLKDRTFENIESVVVMIYEDRVRRITTRQHQPTSI